MNYSGCHTVSYFCFSMTFLNTEKRFVKCFAKLPCGEMSLILAHYFVYFCKNNSHLCLIHHCENSTQGTAIAG